MMVQARLNAIHAMNMSDHIPRASNKPTKMLGIRKNRIGSNKDRSNAGAREYRTK